MYFGRHKLLREDPSFPRWLLCNRGLPFRDTSETVFAGDFISFAVSQRLEGVSGDRVDSYGMVREIGAFDDNTRDILSPRCDLISVIIDMSKRPTSRGRGFIARGAGRWKINAHDTIAFVYCVFVCHRGASWSI